MGSPSSAEIDEGAPLLPSNVSFVSRDPERTRRSRCVTLIGCLSVIMLALMAAVSFTATSEPKTFPPNGPGIGISLSTHYGTIAVRYDDGHIDNAGRVEASAEYTAMLQRLSLPESQHPSPPYHSLSESFRDRPRQWVRSLRKKAGYPASGDVAILAELLRELVTIAEDGLSPTQRPLTSAVVTLPNAIALYPEDAQDALEYLGLQAISGHNVYAVPRALPAAYAGYDQGLCSNPSDFVGCISEEAQMRWRGVVAVDINHHSFAADSRMMSTPMYVFDDHRAVFDWTASYDQVHDGGRLYWRLIRSEIQSVMSALNRTSGKLPGEQIIEEVLIMGNATDDSRLMEVVRDTVSIFQRQNATIRLEQPEHVAARGAAELAKRLLIQGGRLA